MINSNLKCLLADSLNKLYDMTPITNKQAQLLLQTDYSEAYNNIKKGFYIYRGQSDGYEGNPFISIPDYRVSANTINLYTRLMSDILPSWKEYPRRNHSFICTNSLTTAFDYGDMYYVLPKNGTNIGICPKSDIWNSFSNIHKLNIFNLEFMIFISEILNEDNVNIDFKKADSNEILHLFNNITNKLIELIDSSSFIIQMQKRKQLKWINFIIDNIKYKSLTEILDILFNPNDNNFYLSTVKEYSNNESLNSIRIRSKINIHELWFDNEALFIPYSLQRILV